MARGRQNGRAPSQIDGGLPSGFKFHPSAFEVIQVFLYKKLLGLPIFPDMFLEYEVFTVDPGMLPMDCSEQSRTNEGYYFAPKENISSQRRDTPTGYWQIIKENVPVYDSVNRIVGFKNRLSFFHNGAVTDWRMTEYRCNLDGNDNVEERFIACKVREKVREEEEMEDEMLTDIMDDSSEEED